MQRNLLSTEKGDESSGGAKNVDNPKQPWATAVDCPWAIIAFLGVASGDAESRWIAPLGGGVYVFIRNCLPR